VISIEITDQQDTLGVDKALIRQAIENILHEEEIDAAQISVALVDDPTIRRLHKDYLDDDTPTDVMSFVLEDGEDGLEGEVIASADTARARAPEYAWPPENELLLYVIHGTLHLVGYDDTNSETRPEMRRQESSHLAKLGIKSDGAPRGGEGEKAS